MELKKIPLPAEVSYIFNKLRARGFRADIVGGAVRDFLLGKVPGDYDITTSATPDEMLSVFEDDRVVKTGLKHGTLTVIVAHTAYEVTSYRIDGEYLDARHPSEVKFTRDIREDLARRDFTVNAIAYNDIDGYTDSFSGIPDIEAGIIRAVGAPEERFSEDALRILRAIRFSSVLGFAIEPDTAAALYKIAPKLAAISRERVYTEWMKLLGGKNAYAVLKTYSELVCFFIKELDTFKLPERERFDILTPVLRFISLFAGKSPLEFESAARSLKADNKTRDMGAVLLENLDSSSSAPYSVKLLLNKIGEENTRALITLRRALALAETDEEACLDSVLASGECYALSMLKIGGNDLMREGIVGREVGHRLNELLDAVMRGDILNDKDSLILYIKSNM